MMIVMINVLTHQSARILQIKRRFRTNAFLFERTVPALLLIVALGKIGRRVHAGHPAEADKLLEVPGALQIVKNVPLSLRYEMSICQC